MKLIKKDISLSGSDWQDADTRHEVEHFYGGSCKISTVVNLRVSSPPISNAFEEPLRFEAGPPPAIKTAISADASITLTPITSLNVSGWQPPGLRVYQSESLPCAKRAELFEALSKINAYFSDIERSADISLVLWLEPMEQRRLFQVKYTPLPVVGETWTIGLDSKTMVVSNPEARLKWEVLDKDLFLLSETVKEAQTKAQSGEFAAAYKLIFRCVDRAMKAGALDDIDSVLSNISAEDMTLEILIALLTATLPVRTRLPARKAFFLATEKVAKDRNRWSKSLLSGLEG